MSRLESDTQTHRRGSLPGTPETVRVSRTLGCGDTPSGDCIATRGTVLLDFGIARAFATSVSREITRAGLTVGSSSYMSPEQINADQRIDGRSDLYSLGCVLFECLSGRPPFVRRGEAMVLQLHLTEPAPDVRAIRPDVPEDLAGAINRALSKIPAERWRSAAEMRQAVAGCLAA